VRGILRGKIHRTMAVWPAVTQTWSSLPGEQRFRDVQEVTSPGAAVCLVRPDKLHAARSASAARFRRRSGSGSDHGCPVLRGRAREPTPGRAMRPVLRHAVPVTFLPVPVLEESPGPGHDATGASERTHHDGRSGRLLC
jgi:hypothetical protein